MHNRCVRWSPLSVVVICAFTIAAAAAPAASENAGPRPSAPRATALLDAGGDAVVARDISFPQCAGTLPQPRGASFAVLGTNNGMSFTENPCLVRELAWAKRLVDAPAFYANTGNPGPVRARHWPAQASSGACSSSNSNSLACSYDYGWNSAWQSFTVATDAAQRLHHVDRANARHRAANVDWWLDVETMNSWQSLSAWTRTAQTRDVATIAGEIDALRAAGVQNVGIYSTALQWRLITGGAVVTAGRFAEVPVWLAGFASHADAVEGCAHRGFTGGPVRLTQYLGSDGADSDIVCAATPSG